MTTYSPDSSNYGTDEGIRRDLEDASKEIWESIGYGVKLTDGLEELVVGLGSIHCITKALSRTLLTS